MSRDGPGLRLLVVPGISPGRWLRTWSERLPDVPLTLLHEPARTQRAALDAGRADVGLVRLPMDAEGLHVVELWTEETVVVAPRDHLLAATDPDERIAVAELARLADDLVVPDDDVLGWAQPPLPVAPVHPATAAEAVDLVAAGAGLAVVPASLVRAGGRRDVVVRVLDGAPRSRIGLVWLRSRGDDPLIEELVGIVRGRSARSSRGIAGPAAAGAAGAEARSGPAGPAGPAAAGAAPAAAGAGNRSAPGAGQGSTRGSGRRGGPRATRSPRGRGHGHHGPS